MKKKFLIYLIVNLIIDSAIAQDYDLTPSKHSNKWINGKEWSIEEQNEIVIKSYFNKVKSGKLMFYLEVGNLSNSDINIDPDEIFYLITEYDTILLAENFEKIDSQSPSPMSRSKFYMEYFQKYDTIWIENSDKLIKNMKLLTGLGFLFDSDNLAISRGYSKIDYYKQNLLLKNTVEPDKTLKRLLIIDYNNLAKSIEIIIPIGQIEFRIPYTKIQPIE